jgi:integrase
MVARIRQRLQDAYRPSTRRNQDTALMALALFTVYFDLDLKNMQLFSLLAFVEFLVDSKLTVATIKNYLTSLKSKFKLLGLPITVFDSPKLALAIASLEKNNPVIPKHKPILSPTQFKMMYTLSESLSIRLFFKMAIILGYMGFMRISNIAVKSSTVIDKIRDIRRGDISITPQGIWLRWTKTLQRYNQSAQVHNLQQVCYMSLRNPS